MIIKQLLIGKMKVFTYILGCEKTKDAAIIDPAGDEKKIYSEAINSGLTIKYIFNSHYHADHTCGNRKLKSLTGAKILIHKYEVKQLLNIFDPVKIFLLKLLISPKPDIIIDKESFFNVGEIEIKIFHTPGHSPGGLCFLAGNNLFTGDTLFVGDSGMTGAPGGNRKALGESLRMIMNTLPEDTIVWPGHDYGPTRHSTLGWEKRNNINALEYGFFVK
jgi:hydroxyacylglutathione hydrolase